MGDEFRNHSLTVVSIRVVDFYILANVVYTSKIG